MRQRIISFLGCLNSPLEGLDVDGYLFYIALGSHTTWGMFAKVFLLQHAIYSVCTLEKE